MFDYLACSVHRDTHNSTHAAPRWRRMTPAGGWGGAAAAARQHRGMPSARLGKQGGPRRRRFRAPAAGRAGRASSSIGHRDCYELGTYERRWAARWRSARRSFMCRWTCGAGGGGEPCRRRAVFHQLLLRARLQTGKIGRTDRCLPYATSPPPFAQTRVLYSHHSKHTRHAPPRHYRTLCANSA